MGIVDKAACSFAAAVLLTHSLLLFVVSAAAAAASPHLLTAGLASSGWAYGSCADLEAATTSSSGRHNMTVDAIDFYDFTQRSGTACSAFISKVAVIVVSMRCSRYAC
jgi:hypothetical protein